MYTILICDDEQDIVNSLKIFLENSGLQVVCAYNGAEAISAVESQRIDLILLDVMMPRLDGIKAMSLIRQASNVPAIKLSAKGEEEDKISGLGLGADDYITKPYNPAELLARIRSQLRRYTTLGGCTSIEDVIKIGAICLDDREKKVSVDGELISRHQPNTISCICSCPTRGAFFPQGKFTDLFGTLNRIAPRAQ